MKPVTRLIEAMNFMSDHPGNATELKYLEDLVALDNFEIVKNIEVGLVGAGIVEGSQTLVQ